MKNFFIFILTSFFLLSLTTSGVSFAQTESRYDFKKTQEILENARKAQEIIKTARFVSQLSLNLPVREVSDDEPIDVSDIVTTRTMFDGNDGPYYELVMQDEILRVSKERYDEIKARLA